MVEGTRPEGEVAYALLRTEGQISVQAISNECGFEGWVPITVRRVPGRPPIVIAFRSQVLAEKFAKRNQHKSWPIAGINLTEDTLDRIRANGWEIEYLDFPRKMTNELGFEVLEFESSRAVLPTRSQM
jgi:hypothetical protein